MLHYLVRCINTQGTSDAYGEPTEEGYYKKLTNAFAAAVVSSFLNLLSKKNNNILLYKQKGKTRLSTLQVDCANGVGAPKLRELTKYISSDVLSVNIVNDQITALGQLNKNVSVLFFLIKERRRIKVTCKVWCGLCKDSATCSWQRLCCSGREILFL